MAVRIKKVCSTSRYTGSPLLVECEHLKISVVMEEIPLAHLPNLADTEKFRRTNWIAIV